MILSIFRRVVGFKSEVIVARMLAPIEALIRVPF